MTVTLAPRWANSVLRRIAAVVLPQPPFGLANTSVGMTRTPGFPAGLQSVPSLSTNVCHQLVDNLSAVTKLPTGNKLSTDCKQSKTTVYCLSTVCYQFMLWLIDLVEFQSKVASVRP
jgi:hypothetical protein